MDIAKKALRLIGTFLIALAKGIGALVAIGVARFKEYNEAAKTEFHAQRAQEDTSRWFEAARSNEHVVLECFYTALKNSAEIMFVTMPRFPKKCFAFPHIVRLETGRPAYHFWFYYRPDHDMPAEKMTRILKYELAQECYMRGIPLLVPRVTLGADRRASVLVQWKNDKKGN